MPVEHPVRVVSATIGKGGGVNFNQVVLTRGGSPRGVLLVGIDPAAGLNFWLRPFSAVEPHTREQHPGYSRGLAVNMARLPDYLGEPVFIPSDEVDAVSENLWDRILAAQTNTKNKLIRETFGF